MRINKETSETMVITSRHLLVYMIGVVFAVAGLIVLFKPSLLNGDTVPIWLGIIFLLIGIFAVLMNKTTVITIDKTNRTLTVSRNSLITRQQNEYALDRVTRLELRQTYVRGRSRRMGRSGVHYTEQLVFILDDGSEVTLDPSDRSSTRFMGIHIDTKGKIGNRISAFLNIPFEEHRPPTVGEVLSTIKDTVSQAVSEKIDERQQSK